MSSTREPARTARTPSRPDIQVLRALAVGGVLLYHLWPERIAGGYVGVDVFFVVSGFLITSHLLPTAVRSGVHVGRFWARRARRLLPLAGVVLLATIGAALLWMPASTWIPTLRNAVAAALYGQNWLLIHDSVDYLTRDAAPSPTQHFWSLSVEEQFYIVWPLLFVVAIWLAGRSGHQLGTTGHASRARRFSFAAIVLVLVGSFAASVVQTAGDPGFAYFATTTRAWEFAAGALLAFGVSSRIDVAPLTRRATILRTSGAWAGFLTIVGSMLLIPDGAPFPGWIAAIPVLGTVLCLAAGDPGHPFSPTVLGRIRPVTYLGDISYGVYLWHWPLIIVLASAVGPLTTGMKVAVIGGAILLAAISKVLVEDPFRFGTLWTTPWWRGFAPAATSIALVVAVAGSGLWILGNQSEPASAQGEIPDLEAPVAPLEPLVPSIGARVDDKAGMYDCFDLTHEAAHRCSYGPEDAAVRIALTGDSHAAMYIPALRDAAEAGAWRLDTFVGVSCDGAGFYACAGGSEVPDLLEAGGYDLILATGYRGSTTPADDVAAFYRVLVEHDLPVVVIADVPRVTDAAYRCIDDSRGDPVRAADCIVSRTEALDEVPDRAAAAARELAIPVIDPIPVLCTPTGCPQVLGNVVLYQDLNAHLTRTAVMALEPWLEQHIAANLTA
ncbi:acyltransferase family protein [Protaetiibacter mangrovi]|uniref:Acyltransferase n=1 Tax=Protaetiibacter mangrovi TaxID=2970926 RepID=A0ABT1ZGZ6_9MICO|nr:acyltransferase family protein [Protaetiibacter mangrovi]MCS0499995.1 acyltransferase [Protaetiibacter mangrovi]